MCLKGIDLIICFDSEVKVKFKKQPVGRRMAMMVRRMSGDIM